VAPAEPIRQGYRQAGEAHAVIELAGGPLTFVGPAGRTHAWGALPDDGAVPAGVAAYLPVDDAVVTRVLAVDGWSTAVTPRP
jgi:hypothetical protein